MNSIAEGDLHRVDGGSGVEIHALIRELFPICRSITGEGYRQSMEILRRHIPLEVHEVPSGTQVFDWVVPQEWTIRDAYVKDADGERVIDFGRSNLHVMGYSTPMDRRMSLDELRLHLHTLPEHPGWIPYKASYYRPDWGFCLSHEDYERLADGEYEVVIDAEFTDGSLTYGELVLPGSEAREVLISCHACHPSLCNDNLSSIGVATMLAEEISRAPHRYTYRFVFAPGTIGAITWLARNEDKVSHVAAGLVLTNLGDPNGFTYKRSRRGDAEIDRVVACVLRETGSAHAVVDFSPQGGDERQYCSPGFDMPVGSLSRSASGTYPESHNSGDDLDFVTPERLDESLSVLRQVVQTLESNLTYVSLNPKCEPQLGTRGLESSGDEAGQALLWVLNLSDGGHDLLAIAERSGLSFAVVHEAAQRLREKGLVERVFPATSS